MNTKSPTKEMINGGWIGENMIALGSSNKQAGKCGLTKYNHVCLEHIRMKLMNGTSANFHAHNGSVNGSNTAAANKRIVIL